MASSATQAKEAFSDPRDSDPREQDSARELHQESRGRLRRVRKSAAPPQAAPSSNRSMDSSASEEHVRARLLHMNDVYQEEVNVYKAESRMYSDKANALERALKREQQKRAAADAQRAHAEAEAAREREEREEAERAKADAEQNFEREKADFERALEEQVVNCSIDRSSIDSEGVKELIEEERKKSDERVNALMAKQAEQQAALDRQAEQLSSLVKLAEQELGSRRAQSLEPQRRREECDAPVAERRVDKPARVPGWSMLSAVGSLAGGAATSVAVGAVVGGLVVGGVALEAYKGVRSWRAGSREEEQGSRRRTRTAGAGSRRRAGGTRRAA